MFKPLMIWQNYRATLVVGFVGITLTVIATSIVNRWELAEDRERFQQQSSVLVGKLQGELDSYTQLTRSVGAFFNTAQNVSLQEFQELSKALLPYYNGLLGLGWTEKVEAEQRQNYERRFQAQGWSDFRIREYDANGELLPAQDRSVYFPTTYLEPFEVFQNYLGWDAASDIRRLLTLNKAERLDVTVNTPLVQLENGKQGFVLYYPVFRVSNLSTNSTEKIFEGAVFGTYTVKDWVEKAITHLNLNGLDFYLYDLSQDHLNSALHKTTISTREHLLIAYQGDRKILTQFTDSSNSADINHHSQLSTHYCSYSQDWLVCIRSIHIAQQEFSLLVLPTTNRLIFSWRTYAVLILGLLTTISLVCYLLIFKRTTLKVHSKNQELEELLEQLKDTQLQLVQTEKMSSLGRLVAGVAHEINNPVSFILGNVEHAKIYFQDLLSLVNLYQTQYPQPVSVVENFINDIDLDFINQDLPKLLNSMKIGSERLSEIVLSLRNFSRLDESEVKKVDIHAGLDSTLMILNSRLKSQSHRAEIVVIRNYSDLPLVECYPGKLNQVFMNILANAIDALEDGIKSGKLTELSPQITIETSLIDSQWVAVEISDNGLGIPTEIQSRLFDPFFTTKPVGQGTGLGLSISYQIITEKHGGHLFCFSELEKGTKFVIKLPICQLTNYDI